MPDCLSHYQYVDLKRAAAEGVPFAEAIKPLTKVGFTVDFLKAGFGELFPEFAEKKPAGKPAAKPDPLA